MDDFDFFISYSHDDAGIGDDIARGLRSRGYRVWFDGFEIAPGDSVRDQIDDGLRRSRLGVVLLSRSYFSRHWTRRELDALFSLDARRLSSQLLPVLLDLSQEELPTYSPLLSSLVSISAADGIEHVLDHLARRAGDPMGRRAPDLTALREQAERLADERLSRAKISRDDFEAYQSLGRQLIDVQSLESAPLYGPEPLDDPDYIALLGASKDFVYEIMPRDFLLDLDRRGLSINQAVLAGHAKWPVESLKRKRPKGQLGLFGAQDDDADNREQRGRLLRVCRSLLFARPSLYFPHDMSGQVLRPAIPDLVLVIAFNWSVEVRSAEPPFRVLARLEVDHQARAATLGKLRGEPTLLIRTTGGLLAWSPWIDPQPLAEIPVQAADSLVLDTHCLMSDQMQSALVTDEGVLGLARDLELYETHALGRNDLHGLVWLPQGSLIGWYDRGLCRVRGAELEPVLSTDDLLQTVRSLPDPRARSCTAIQEIKSLTIASLHGRPLVLAVFSFDTERTFDDSLAALYLEIEDRGCDLRGYLFPPPAARGLAPLPADQGRDRVAVRFTQWFGQSQQETPIRWYHSVETNTATTFVEAGRLDADHRGIALLAALTKNRVIAYDIDGKVTVRDLGGSTAPVVLHEGFGVRAMRLCDATPVRNATEMIF